LPLQIPNHPFRAYLFDCDGTIADSMPLHFLAWNKALARHNCPFPEDLFYEWGGRPVPEIVAQLNRDHNLSMNVEEVSREKEELYVELIPQLQPIPDVLAEIHRAHGQIPFAVVSGSPRDSVVRTLTALGILDLFDTLVCAGEYVHGKPHPEPFLLAAQKLGVEPSACLVFEDADLGIQAATAAGMQSVKIPPPQPLTHL
jgi:HAD superfamily hydrolase (TIGR01509 family)